MIYFDNSATGGFKPHAVYETASTVMKYLSANPGRSGHRLATTGAERIYLCRELLANYFNCLPERVIFTKNCTEALNFAILGSAVKGSHVITTVYEHNSVLRPLRSLQKTGFIELSVISEKAENLATAIENAIKENTSAVIVNSLSNVTGEILPILKIGKVCLKHNLFFIVDGAQGGGHIGIDMKKCNISALCLAGHKGLYGIMGSGALLLNDNFNVKPITFGGTGIDSFNEDMPSDYPEKLEAGTLNLPAICALYEGAKYSMENLNIFQNTLLSYTEKTIEGLNLIDNVRCYSKPNVGGIIAFEIPFVSSVEIADTLNSDYDIAVRGGFHCAPLLHKFLSTQENGLVRVSLAPQNTLTEINYFISSIKRIARKIK